MAKKFNRAALLALLLFLFAGAFETYACTSVIISGKLTPDGRPLMWKNRDTTKGQNMAVFINGKKYDFIGVVNPGLADPKSVYGGVNTEGLCVMNTLSFNVDVKAVRDNNSTANGELQYQLLSNCKNMAEVEAFLTELYGRLTPEDLPVPTGLDANLGVIDAEGNGAYFECHSYGFKKFDVNDPKVAPEGFLVRSNFSVSTRPAKEGKGQMRYMEVERQMRRAIADGTVNVDFILQNLARSYSNPFLGIDLKSGDFNKPKAGGWAAQEDFISNNYSVSSMVFEGIKKGEKPELTTMWTIIGYPACAVCVPLWVKGGKKGIPEMLAPDATLHSPMSRNAEILRKKVYSFNLDNSAANHNRYFNWEMLYNLEGSGIMQKVMAKEARILVPYKAAQEIWRRHNNVDVQLIYDLNKETDLKLKDFYRDVFGL
ncbi:MAG: hypothetical protein IKX03_04960 [Bacteroidales bacterium]|nr:hypothetical protein [Bacteroidales bacterium]